MSPGPITHELHIVPVPNQANSFKIRIGSERAELPRGMLPNVHPHDEVSWVNELPKLVVIEFYAEIRNNSRSLTLFENENPTRTIMIEQGQKVQRTVREDVDCWEAPDSGDPCNPMGYNIHYYRLKGMALDQPGPGIIVCPPGTVCNP
jgi:hypothetical protein